MTVRSRILAYLKEHPEGIDDDVLTAALGLSRRQQTNQECRRLQVSGIVERYPVDGKIRNFLVGQLTASPPVPDAGTQAFPPERQASWQGSSGEARWYWEGNVQAEVVKHLAAHGHCIVRVADTASREAGKDIVAVSPSGQQLWVTVKGYPEATQRTNPATQARHWFTAALYDVVAWRGEDPKVAIMLALPDFPTYRKLARRVAWLLPEIDVCVSWVGDRGVLEA